jgi:hypothetical protein
MGTHSLNFDPDFTHLTEARLELSLCDDDRDFWPSNREFGGGIAEDFTRDFGEIDTGAYSCEMNVNFLEGGEFTVLVGGLKGDFCIDKSILTVPYEPVPEPGAVILLGLGLFGLGPARFRKKRQ